MTHSRPSKPEIFNAAAELRGATERSVFLDGACGGDKALRAEIEDLLRHDAASAPEPPLESAGATIGPYKLLEQIGEGGFGVVFMAEQTAPVRRRVALKVIKPGMDTRQVIARFEAERQALALMDHPNIARVLDAGTTGTGRPFFVMELVRGIPITEYCDAHRLTPRARLDLFVSVCHAVQHAHQKGIIHRDLKPSNVLVALHDDRPVAKVIDFGVAKATSGPLTDKTVFTAFAQMVGTPLYMSPEQASMNALDIDTRSDVYSLGVLLYELLTGTTPFDASRLKEAAFDEVRRIVREEEPQKPSTRLSTAETLPTVAEKRGTEPARLTRLVRGELDWIVMKALEKDRSRRYATAYGFAMDVQRYLADEAVSACPPSAGYRLRKFAQRHRRALGAAALVGSMLLVVAGSVGWMARDGAARRARTAEAVEGLLDRCEDALRADQPEQAALALESAERRAADGGAEGLEGRLAQCRNDFKMLRELDAIDVLSWTWANERFTGAEVVAARWLEALKAYGITPEEGEAGEAAERVRESLIRDRLLAGLDRWLAARDLVVRPSDQGTDSQAIDRGCLAGVRAVLRQVDPDPYRDAIRDAIVASDVSALAELVGRPDALAQPARFAAALGLVRHVPVERRRAVLKSALRRRPGDLVLLMALGDSYPESWPAEAVRERVRWFQGAVAAHPGNVAAQNNLGAALAVGGDADEAIACFEAAIAIDRTFARAYYNLGLQFTDKRELDKAIACYRDAIRHAPNYAPAYYYLATALGKKGDAEGAIRDYERAIELDPNYLVAHYDLGCTLAANGQPDEAIVCYENALRLDPNYAAAHVNWGVVLLRKGNVEGAIRHFEWAIELDPNRQEAHCSLGAALWAKGDPDAAIASCEKAIRLDPNDPMARVNLGGAYRAKGQLDRAIGCFLDALRLDPKCVAAHGNLGNALLDKADVDGAIDCYEKVLRLAPNDAKARGRLKHALKEREARVALEARLPDVLAGQATSPDEQVKLADLCLRFGERNADAALLYDRAFAADPRLSAEPNGHRYNAACAGALAAAGQGVGVEAFEPSDRARLRGLALGWLRAELASLVDLAAGDAAAVERVRASLKHWLNDTDLRGIRDEGELARLPDEERERWTKLWNDVRDLVARTAKN